jgi:DNA-binding NarL/FixJ family response regulator
VVTARADHSAKQQAICAECDALLLKPCAPSTLAEVIALVLAQPRVVLDDMPAGLLIERLSRSAAQAKLLVRRATSLRNIAKRTQTDSQRTRAVAHVSRAKRH